MHHDIDTIERMEIIRDLRLGEFDVLVGINLLREGLDLPEVSLVAILDADKEGFLRSETALIQTIGRAARNADGEVILYADTDHPLHAAGHGRDAARRRAQAGRLQQGPRHHRPRPSARTSGSCWRSPSPPSGTPGAVKQLTKLREARAHRQAGKADERGRQDAGVRAGRRAA